jgi:hypothetical protein
VCLSNLWNDSGTIFLSSSRLLLPVSSLMMAATLSELWFVASSRKMLQGWGADDADTLRFASLHSVNSLIICVRVSFPYGAMKPTGDEVDTWTN